MQARKTHGASKIVVDNRKKVTDITTSTTAKIARIVGATFGPAGSPVAIDNPHSDDFPAILTKDGVTVLSHLGFRDTTEHVVYTIMRDVALQTAKTVGDGTTTTTVLADALVQAIAKCKDVASPQAASRRLVRFAEDVLQPMIKKMAKRASITKHRAVLYKTALTSSNGDERMSEAVIQCFERGGDLGNVNIWPQEENSYEYRVQPIDGYPIDVGYEDSCRRFYPAFMNDDVSAAVDLKGARFLSFNGQIFNFQQAFSKLLASLKALPAQDRKLVVAAHDFSDDALDFFQKCWGLAKKDDPNGIYILPVKMPMTMQAAGVQHALEDLVAMTAGVLVDPSNAGDHAFSGLSDLVDVEMKRNLTFVTPHGDGYTAKAKERMEKRAQVILQQLKQATSQLDKVLIEERLAKVTQSLIRLVVTGPSKADLKERCDHAEDAVCAVRSALKDGIVFGGGWAWYRLLGEMQDLRDKYPYEVEVFTEAFSALVSRLIENFGELESSQIDLVVSRNVDGIKEDKSLVFNLFSSELVDGKKLGVYDSAASIEVSLRNALVIATQLGSLSGIIAFPRDNDLELSHAEAMANIDRVMQHANNAINGVQ